MHNILVLGAGKIGTLIACLLQESGDYQVFLADLNIETPAIQRLKTQKGLKFLTLDINNQAAVHAFLQQQTIHGLVSSLPYYANVAAAEAAKAFQLAYFDLTEDVAVTQAIKKLAQDAQQPFVPQCGLAPGFVGLTAHSLMQEFQQVESVQLRVGALPASINNALYYALTWSTEGLINQYINPCFVIDEGQARWVPPLENIESLEIDGLVYEAFNTSGGLGSLGELCKDQVQAMNYKTIRYPGHCQKMQFLIHDLKLNQDRPTLKRILEHAIPKTYQDVVIIYVAVSGQRENEYLEKSYVKKIYPHKIAGLDWSAIQVTTAAGICSVVDMVFADLNKFHGFVYQEQFLLAEVLANRFGQYFR